MVRYASLFSSPVLRGDELLIEVTNTGPRRCGIRSSPTNATTREGKQTSRVPGGLLPVDDLGQYVIGSPGVLTFPERFETDAARLAYFCLSQDETGYLIHPRFIDMTDVTLSMEATFEVEETPAQPPGCIVTQGYTYVDGRLSVELRNTGSDAVPAKGGLLNYILVSDSGALLQRGELAPRESEPIESGDLLTFEIDLDFDGTSHRLLTQLSWFDDRYLP